MGFADFPFLRYLPFLVFGVLLSQIGWQFPILFVAILIGLAGLFYAFVVAGKKKFSKLLPAFLAYTMLFSLGILLSEVQKRQSANSFDPRLEFCDSYLARVAKYDLEKPNSWENLLEVIQIKDSAGWHSSKGKVLVYHKGQSPLLPGEVVLVESSPEAIPQPIFPDEFDYRGFLARKGIHFRQFVGQKFLLIDSSDVDSPQYWMEKLRKSLAGIVVEKVPDPESQQIAVALLLGQKEALDREIRNAYAETGTMHILAVSGLHVGIIYSILLFPLKGLRVTLRQRKFYLLLVILLIWVYAILTGFSPSVVRAAAMFSLFTLGQMRDRKPSPWNVLAFSALIIVAMDPVVIFDVGFQLSYAAVGGILLLQPLILRWWLPRNRVLEYIWQMTAVSLAAQLATFPLSVLYFHVFPTYFLFANLAIIPLSFLVMNAGILLLAMSWVPGLGDGLGWVVNGLIWCQNWITRAIQEFPGGNLDRLTITFSGMLLIWGLLIVWANWEWGERRKLIYLAVFLFTAWSGDLLIREIKRPTSEVLVFSGEKGVLMDFKIGENVHAWNEGFPAEQISFSIDPNRIAEHRPQMPEPVFALTEGQLRWVPLWDFRFDADSGKLLWGKSRPIRIEQFSFPNSWTSVASDSLIVNSGAFRVVF